MFRRIGVFSAGSTDTRPEFLLPTCWRLRTGVGVAAADKRSARLASWVPLVLRTPTPVRIRLARGPRGRRTGVGATRLRFGSGSPPPQSAGEGVSVGVAAGDRRSSCMASSIPLVLRTPTPLRSRLARWPCGRRTGVGATRSMTRI